MAARKIDPRALGETELIEAVLARCEFGWRELLRRYRALALSCIHKVLSRYRSTGIDADELYAEFCLRLMEGNLRRLRLYDPERGAKLGTWLGMIAAHTAHDVLRKAVRRPQPLPVEAIDNECCLRPTSFDELEAKQEQEKFFALLSRSSDRDRDFVELYYQRGLPPDEVARAMKISVQTVYTKTNKLRARLMELAAVV